MNDTCARTKAAAETIAIDDLPVCYFELDTEGRIVCANRHGCMQNCGDEGCLTGKTPWDNLAPREAEAQRREYLELMRSGHEPPVIRRSLYMGRAGFRSHEIHRSLMHDSHGHVVGIRAVVFDVTELEVAHQEAHQARQWLESILDSVAEAIIVTDALGFVRSANRAAEDMFGWKAGELVGQIIEKKIPLLLYSNTGRWELSFQMALCGPAKGIATVLDRERNAMRVEVSASPIIDKENGCTTGVVSVWRRLDEKS